MKLYYALISFFICSLQAMEILEISALSNALAPQNNDTPRPSMDIAIEMSNISPKSLAEDIATFKQACATNEPEQVEYFLAQLRQHNSFSQCNFKQLADLENAINAMKINMFPRAKKALIAGTIASVAGWGTCLIAFSFKCQEDDSSALCKVTGSGTIANILTCYLGIVGYWELTNRERNRKKALVASLYSLWHPTQATITEQTHLLTEDNT